MRHNVTSLAEVWIEILYCYTDRTQSWVTSLAEVWIEIGSRTVNVPNGVTSLPLRKCGQLLGIELLDHIIVGGINGKMLSFREEKMLKVTGRMDWGR